MAMDAQSAYGALTSYVNETLKGEGALKGRDGKDGKDGFSPIATVERTNKGAKITVIDANGTTEAEIEDGNALMDVDEEFLPTSNHAIANSVVTNKFYSVDSAVADVSNKADANELAINVLNGTGEGSVRKTVTDKVAEIVADAPEDFDTLKEMSDWISNHEDDAVAMNSQIQANKAAIDALSNEKVDKEIGKGLSTEDFTTGEKNKLSGLQNYDDSEVKAEIADIKTADYGAGVNVFDFDMYAEEVNSLIGYTTISNNEDGSYSVSGIENLHWYYVNRGIFKFADKDTDVIFSIKLKKGTGFRVYVSLWNENGDSVATDNNEDAEGSITLRGVASGIVFSYGSNGSYTFVEPMIRPASISDDTFYPYIPTNEKLAHDVNILHKRLNSPVFGFHISDDESEPSAKITPLADSVGMTPAAMDYTSGAFNYGSWGDVWFVRDTKPCILGQDGTVQHYLNRDDFTKNLAGDTVAIDENLTGANVMSEFPKIWYKVVPDSTGHSADVYISPVKVDEDFVDYPYIDYQRQHKEHFYMPCYNGSLVSNVLRSVSGQAVAYNYTAEQEIAYAKANGNGWYTEDAGEIQLINFLLLLMGMSTDTQTVFGRGIDTGSGTAFYAYRTGAGNGKGMFWGANDGTQLVKVFGIENWWGLQWRRYAGEVLDNGARLIKLCYGNEDGSAVLDFNIDGTGYVNVGITPSGTNGGYISKMKFTKSGMYSEVSSGSATTHYCDGQWFDNAYHTIYALRGGAANDGLPCGALCCYLDDAPGYRYWDVGAGVSYK